MPRREHALAGLATLFGSPAAVVVVADPRGQVCRPACASGICETMADLAMTGFDAVTRAAFEVLGHHGCSAGERGRPPTAVRDARRVRLAEIDLPLKAAGGYLSGWLFEPDWRAHFGASYDAWVEAKRRFDPTSTFCSALFPA